MSCVIFLSLRTILVLLVHSDSALRSISCSPERSESLTPVTSLSSAALTACAGALSLQLNLGRGVVTARQGPPARVWQSPYESRPRGARAGRHRCLPPLLARGSHQQWGHLHTGCKNPALKGADAARVSLESCFLGRDVRDRVRILRS